MSREHSLGDCCLAMRRSAHVMGAQRRDIDEHIRGVASAGRVREPGAGRSGGTRRRSPAMELV